MKENVNDCWRTPDWLFDKLNKEFNFDIDLCASKNNAKCLWYLTDYLNTDMHSRTRPDSFPAKCAFMNPPYSNAKPFIQKAWDDSKHCKIVCIIKCDPSTSMWQIFYDFQTGKPKPGCDIKLINKRIQFDPPLQYKAWKIGQKWAIECDHCIGTKTINWPAIPCTTCKATGYKILSGPAFPSCLLIFDRRNLPVE